ncbi:peptidyl-prolyl cis-trans isomerase (rotamase) - cyclophilin family [Bernardetia litoralis DSM 6794]|uniref:peptidylprolyl isomerase n=1 Tax=Bernardetia litoralis (strain ATCC 23117 / DSM 6794 / NBRC 15988 / NCIMB 1366 / Fx l1 / Sio-4) TaxID=880071 RepID=I4AFJ9_BERLS|nr:peptidylprolyl isomerase [Bernardetia litoralis]AFM02734.1 peptidyl-prolyl cis-trans isomerase (rotamase) - cyclophilin family [Bernardetia litoralis DSM 6794]
MKFLYSFIFPNSFFLGLLLSIFALNTACTPDKIEKPPKDLEKFIKRNVFHSDTILQKIYDAANRRDAKTVASFFSDSQEKYRKHAALTFASLQDSSFLLPLLELLNDEKPSVRKAAATAIGQFWATSSEDLLIEKVTQMQVYGSYDVNVQQRLLEAIGKSATKKGLQFLALQNYENDTLRVGQAIGIYRAATKPNRNAQIISDSATVLMLDFLTVPKQNYTVRLMASAYFARLANKIIPKTEKDSIQGKKQNDFFEILKNKADKDSQIFIRSNAIQALSAIKTKESEEFLIQILNKTDENYLVKISAIRALGKFDNSLKIKKIIENYINAKNPNLQIVASQTLKELALLTDYKLYLGWAEKANNNNYRTKANLLAGAIKTEKTENIASQKVISLLDSSNNFYEKMAFLQALSENIQNIDLILDTLQTTQNHLLRTSATEALLNISTNFLVQNSKLSKAEKEVAKKIAQGFEFAINSSDVGAIALASNGLMNEKLKENIYRYNLRKLVNSLTEAQNKLVLPREIETYQEISKAIEFYTGKTSQIPPSAPTKGIDWKLIQTLDARNSIVLNTNKGEIIVSLFTEEAPATVASFINLAGTEFFNKKKFHRVVPNFVVQGGDPRGDGWGSVDYTIRSEFSTFYYDDEGYLGMASAGKDTESCQFFITHSPTPHLDGRYTIFGKVIKGMEVVHKLEVGDYIEMVSF